jgi:hypothetical protein
MKLCTGLPDGQADPRRGTGGSEFFNHKLHLSRRCRDFCAQGVSMWACPDMFHVLYFVPGTP